MIQEKIEIEKIKIGYDTEAKQYSFSNRKKLESSHLRDFNNWVKSALIEKYCPGPNANILDLACGKGGDIPKYKLKNPSQIVFADISEESLKKAYLKYHSISDSCLSVFISGDIFNYNISTFISGISFHLASCQFALHYAFLNLKRASTAINNLSNSLHPGGHIILTIPNALRIVKLFQETESDIIENKIFRIKRYFDIKSPIPAFGAAYSFYLEGAVPDLKEYLIHPEVLKKLFFKNNIKLIEMKSFHEYYEDCTKDTEKKRFFLDLLKKRPSFESIDITEEEWFVCSLYSIAVFQKNGDLPSLSKESIKRNVEDKFLMSIIDLETQTEKKIEIKK